MLEAVPLKRRVGMVMMLLGVWPATVGSNLMILASVLVSPSSVCSTAMRPVVNGAALEARGVVIGMTASIAATMV